MVVQSYGEMSLVSQYYTAVVSVLVFRFISELVLT